MHKRKVDINEIVKDVHTKSKAAAKSKGLSFDLKLSGKVEPIWVDPQRISQLLENLVSNGIKFNKEKGKIIIYSSKENVDGRDFIKVAVEDTGMGISEDKLPKLFRKFNPLGATMTRSYGGVGLGLAICKNIVRLHGGEIWAESEEDIGTRFMFRLPVYRKEDEFDFLLDWALERAKYNNLELSLIVFGLKDTGYANEEALLELEKTAQSIIKGPEDMVMRFNGGKEIALMAGTNRDGAEKIVKRLKGKTKLSLNFGISVYPEETGTKEDLVKRVKKDMVRKKDIL
jgi:hypothetical protein